MAKKVVKKSTKVPVKEVTSEATYPNAYQNVRGVLYLRPLNFQCDTDGVMKWLPDVDNYPDKK